MNVVANIKRFVLRTLQVAGTPMPEAALQDAILLNVGPKPLLSEIHQAFRELEKQDGFIVGVPDEFDRSLIYWSLTSPNGQSAASRLR
jgi:hypothetical protein